MCKVLSERILWPSNWSQHRFLVHEMRVDAHRHILWLSFRGLSFRLSFCWRPFFGSKCSPRPVAVSPAVIFLAVTGAPRCCRGQRIIPACRDTDRCAASYVSWRVAGPKTRFLSHDTDRIGKLSVSWRAGLRRLLFAATPFALTLERTVTRDAGTAGRRKVRSAFLFLYPPDFGSDPISAVTRFRQ